MIPCFVKLVMFLFFILFASSIVQSVNPPLEIKEQQEITAQYFSFPLKFLIGIYRNFAGKARDSSCPMKPSCSTFGMQAIKTYGPFPGSLMTVDRLNRCGHDQKSYSLAEEEDKILLWDPIENNWLGNFHSH